MTTDVQIVALQSEIATQMMPIVVRQAMADGIMAVAAKANDWPLLHQAIDLKIGDQREFVAEWDRRVRPAGNPALTIITDRVTIGVAALTAETGLTAIQVSRWRRSLADETSYHLKIFTKACKAAGVIAPDNHRAMGTGENEWFTPPVYIEAARTVLGTIDLDPATHPLAQQAIQAVEHFTAADNALSREWHGRVWLNPPYARTLIEPFITKLLAELAAQRVTEAILLTHSYTDTGWFHLALSQAAALCLTLGRVRFADQFGAESNPTQGQVFFYYGRDCGRFGAAFRQFGAIVVPE